MDARTAAVIRIDAVWLAVEPLDMRAGTETALARVVIRELLHSACRLDLPNCCVGQCHAAPS